MIKKLKVAGLGYNVDEGDTADRFGVHCYTMIG